MFHFFINELKLTNTILQHTTSKRIWSQAPEKVASLVSDKGVVITRKTVAAVDVLSAGGFEVIDVGKQVLFGVRPLPASKLAGRKALIVVRLTLHHPDFRTDSR